MMKPLGVNIDVDRLGLEAAIKRAVEDEREACAQIAENCADKLHNGRDKGVADLVARAIRARAA